jgi:hypothetical protein
LLKASAVARACHARTSLHGCAGYAQNMPRRPGEEQ